MAAPCARDSKWTRLLVAYALLVFLGWFGMHRFYLGHTRSAKWMLGVTLVSVPLLVVGGLGAYGLLAVFYVMVADLFVIAFILRRMPPPERTT